MSYYHWSPSQYTVPQNQQQQQAQEMQMRQAQLQEMQVYLAQEQALATQRMQMLQHPTHQAMPVPGHFVDVDGEGMYHFQDSQMASGLRQANAAHNRVPVPTLQRYTTLPTPGPLDESEERMPSPPLKRQRGNAVGEVGDGGSWAGTLPKLSSPVLTIHVGAERKLFQIHKAMFVQAARYFDRMFNGKFLESVTSAAEFPDDDPAAWELLVQWCYTGKLPALTRQASDAVFNAEVTKFCSVRLKLCCLADKYGMVLLHNLAMDSINAFLRHAGPGMKLEWKVFKSWCRYVYENSNEHSPLRKFITSYFHLVIRSGAGGGRGPPLFKIEKLYKLATDLPDLTKDLFEYLRMDALVVPNCFLEPWEHLPCDFHLHPGAGSDEVQVQCPMSLVAAVSTWPKSAARLQYWLQNMTLKGTAVCYVSQGVDELGVARSNVQGGVEELVQNEVARWVVERHSFTLALPSARSGGRGTGKVPGVKVVAPTPEGEMEGL
ncbi:hypothetical protein MBM_03917 [Drepanopeziza brunnea f. sp. 'multigermtubi' MB_m1]|uniref:BTB domain-containing protein n=1 Tax=Marssonina brunnea f. sp. multigermtubi (strain MB_m1) TaxID=1072389 RepID=K1WKI7_MARBU|nr:uncharacterized protein MBM_03917 [Drepanopeziza brunnea f. sp. 'multigermtubi' MB_m1]EKD18145.1 hypothetical protein MBM_03917 [Drepanopeziza brunnea f. sp. 'multigermtubi' MB_m1]